jgi:hypothetical protein
MAQYVVNQFGNCHRYQVVEAEDEMDARQKINPDYWEYDFDVMDDEVYED